MLRKLAIPKGEEDAFWTPYAEGDNAFPVSEIIAKGIDSIVQGYTSGILDNGHAKMTLVVREEIYLRITQVLVHYVSAFSALGAQCRCSEGQCAHDLIALNIAL